MSNAVETLGIVLAAGFWLLILSVPLMVAAGVIWLIVRAGAALGIVPRYAGASGAGGHPACGRCGFDVRGLRVLRCPECGADLLSVGIVGTSPGGAVPRGSSSVVKRILGWSVIYPTVLLLASVPCCSGEWLWASTWSSVVLWAVLLVGWLVGVLVILRRMHNREVRGGAKKPEDEVPGL